MKKPWIIWVHKSNQFAEIWQYNPNRTKCNKIGCLLGGICSSSNGLSRVRDWFSITLIWLLGLATDLSTVEWTNCPWRYTNWLTEVQNKFTWAKLQRYITEYIWSSIGMFIISFWWILLRSPLKYAIWKSNLKADNAPSYKSCYDELFLVRIC